jgi:hypothetical protein
MNMYPTSAQIRGAIARTREWEECKQLVDDIITAMCARGARFYRYCNQGVYAYLDHTLFNLENKTQAYELLRQALGTQQIPDRKRIYSIFYLRIDGLAIEVSSANIDQFVKTVIETEKHKENAIED